MSTSALPTLPTPSKGHRAEAFSVDGHGQVHIGDRHYYGSPLGSPPSPFHNKNLGGVNHQAYTVGWICAVKTEYVAACELLDEEHPPLPTVSSHDSNAYTLGRIGDHHVVVACLPKGRYGIASAATVAKDMLRSFESVRIGLMVGIGGGAPSHKHDIRLGDVVVGCPMGRTGGVLPYNFGEAVQGKEFEITASLNSPPTLLLTALNQLDMLHERKGHQIAETVRTMVNKNPRIREKYQYPGQEKDRWYESTYTHIDGSIKCDSGCDRTVPPMTPREQRSIDPDDPVVHYGIIASAHQLMKDAVARDRISQQHNVLCFEMEAAGLSNDFPCVIIRGICDYSDTHKNDEWQGYAAATAASYAKELLKSMPGSGVTEHRRAFDQVSKAGPSKPKRPNLSISAKSATRSMGHHRTQEQLHIRQQLLLKVSNLALVIPSLSAGFEKVTRDINRFRREVASAPLMMVFTAEQCSTICSAIARLQSLELQDAAAFEAQHHQIIHILESIMIGCKGTLSLIEEYLMDPWASKEESLNGNSEKSKLTATTESVWKGEEMRELFSQLKGYQNSLSKLLDVSERKSVDQMRGHLVNQTAVLDDLLERSRKSWKSKAPSMLASSYSLRFSILSDSNEFSTTAWNMDYEKDEKDEPPATSFPFDHELKNSKVYRRAILNRMRRESVQSSSKQLNGDIDAASLDLSEGYPMAQVSKIDTLNNAAPSVASDVSDGVTRAASPPKPHLPFADNKNLGMPQNLQKVVPNYSRRALCPPNLLHSWPGSDAEDTCQTPFLGDSHPLSAASAPPRNVKKTFSEPNLALEAAITRAEAPRLCKVLLFGSGAVGKSPLVLQFVSSQYVDEYDPTIEDTYWKRCLIDEELVDLDITDLSGQLEYSELWDQHIRTCDCFLLIYSITSRLSFQEIHNFQEHICRIRNEKYLPFILVGNKCDLAYGREVSSTEGYELANEIGCPFFEASAKNGTNVDKVFHQAVRETRRYGYDLFDWIVQTYGDVPAAASPKHRQSSELAYLSRNSRCLMM